MPSHPPEDQKVKKICQQILLNPLELFDLFEVGCLETTNKHFPISNQLFL